MLEQHTAVLYTQIHPLAILFQQGLTLGSSKVCKSALLNSLISKTPLISQITIFNNVNFEICTFVQVQCLWWAQGETKGPMNTKFFAEVFTHNFDISISHRELTLYAT